MPNQSHDPSPHYHLFSQYDIYVGRLNHWLFKTYLKINDPKNLSELKKPENSEREFIFEVHNSRDHSAPRPHLTDIIKGTWRRLRITQEDYDQIVKSLPIYESGDVWSHLVDQAKEERKERKRLKISDRYVDLRIKKGW